MYELDIFSSIFLMAEKCATFQQRAENFAVKNDT